MAKQFLILLNGISTVAGAYLIYKGSIASGFLCILLGLLSAVYQSLIFNMLSSRRVDIQLTKAATRHEIANEVRRYRYRDAGDIARMIEDEEL